MKSANQMIDEVIAGADANELIEGFGPQDVGRDRHGMDHPPKEVHDTLKRHGFVNNNHKFKKGPKDHYARLNPYSMDHRIVIDRDKPHQWTHYDGSFDDDNSGLMTVTHGVGLKSIDSHLKSFYKK